MTFALLRPLAAASVANRLRGNEQLLKGKERTPEHRFHLFFTNVMQWSKTAELVNRSLAVIGKPPLTPVVFVLFFALAGLGDKVALIRNHYGTICHAALVIFSLFLLYSGQSTFAIPYLVILLIGFLKQAAVLPEIAKRPFAHATTAISILFILIYGQALDRALILIDGILSVYDRLTKPEEMAAIALPDPRQIDDFAKELFSKVQFQVNRNHIRYPIDAHPMLKALQKLRLEILEGMLKDMFEPSRILILNSLRQLLGLEPPTIAPHPLNVRLVRFLFTRLGLLEQFWEIYLNRLKERRTLAFFYKYHILDTEQAT